MGKPKFETIEVAVDGGRGELHLNRPEKLNPLSNRRSHVLDEVLDCRWCWTRTRPVRCRHLGPPCGARSRPEKRVLLTVATGTGKPVIAFQICWRLWSTGWNRTGEFRKPRILYLADRNVLVDDPKDKILAPFGDARRQGAVHRRAEHLPPD